MRKLFEKKENRDKAWKESGGGTGRRTTVRNQRIHPQYIEDFEGPEKDDTGFGNTVYKTHFPVLYVLQDHRHDHY